MKRKRFTNKHILVNKALNPNSFFFGLGRVITLVIVALLHSDSR